MLGIKQSTQNDFVHGELGRIDHQSRRYINTIRIVKLWLKIVHTEERKYIECTYNMMLNDIDLRPK